MKPLQFPQQQCAGARPGIECLLDAPYNDTQQVATILPVQNVSSALLVRCDQPWGEKTMVMYEAKWQRLWG